MKSNSKQFYHKTPTKKGEKPDWCDLFGSSLGLAVASKASDSTMLIVTPDASRSIKLKQEIKFFLGKKDIQVKIFPGWETLPYDHFSPHEGVISERLSILYQLASGKKSIVLVDVQTLMHRLPPKEYIEANSFIMKVGETIDFNSLRYKFEEHGYSFVTKVMEHGEFAVRGSIIDVFPMGSSVPYRIDFFDTEIDSIRIFDVDTQRSFKNIDDIKLLPAKEFPLDEDGVDRFCDSWCSHFGYERTRSGIYQDISSGKMHPGVEYYLPLFFEKTSTFFDYLSSDTQIISLDDIEKSAKNFWDEVNVRYEQLRHDVMRPILAPKDIFVEPAVITRSVFCDEAIQKCFKNIGLLRPAKNAGLAMMTNVAFKKLIKDFPNARILFSAKTAGRREFLIEYLQKVKISPGVVESWQTFLESEDRFCITISGIEEPAHVVLERNNQEILIITEHQIFSEKVIEREAGRSSAQKVDAIIRDLTELQISDPIVHIDYGVGRYLGLKKLKVDNQENEFLELEYANQAKLYVPITSLNLVGRYTGVDKEHAPLNHLGSKQWDKTKRQAKEKIRDTAVELLEICARRLNAKGFTFVKPEKEYDRFVESFPFVVTQDQERAINEVLDDMTSSRPMDRLICGDVGFGKTEVAMRAAFLAVYNGKQVAILTPTTLLAGQHFENFVERFDSWPIKIALLSRFKGGREQQVILDDLASGKIDIIIGTHKLLQKNVKFNNLGLLVVDEEHRFGVRQKEYIKNLALNVDVLSLTATPIPRTLNMAFGGIRDFSIISTPPAKRLAIKTFVSEYQPYLIKEAILRETMRGGQVYFLHNNVSTIEKFADELHRLVPEARIALAHGQMRKQNLERIMRDFYQLRINVLVCTTIIESGLDIPTANTIIINRADKFGLAQLHQLRGRVGRSHHQAYAYLITPPVSALTADAKKRLDAITHMKDLGAGFVLATNDLEIRGAGELLGEKQSGVMQGIGFSLYMDMLKSAIKTLKGKGRGASEDSVEIKTEIDLKISALIPDKYIRDLNLRLVLYKRIAEASDQDELEELRIEMLDRFGMLLESTKNLFKITELKLKAAKLGIAKIHFGVTKGVIEFKPEYKGDPNKIISAMQKYSLSFKFPSANSVEFTSDKNVSKIELIDKLLAELFGGKGQRGQV